MKTKLTDTFLNRVKYNPKGNNIYWDTNFPGFGISVGKTNYRSFRVYAYNNFGKKICRVIGRADILTIEEAKERARNVMKGIRYNINTLVANEQKCPSLDRVYSDFLKTKELRPNTRKMFSIALNTYFSDWKDKPINAITKDMVKDRFLKISNQTKSGANSYFTRLSSLMSFTRANYNNVLDTNPCNILKALKLWNRIERRKGKLYEEDFKPIVRELNSYTDKDIIFRKLLLFLLFTGCRLNEATNLKWEDIDFKHRIITFRNTKNHSTHLLPMGNWLKNNLEELYDSNYYNNNIFVFRTNNTRGYSYKFRKVIDDIVKKSSITFIPHDLRRTFASIADHHIASNYSHYIVKRLLNHTSGDVTAGYVSVELEDLREPMQEIENYILSRV